MTVRMRNTIANGGLTGKDATINKVFSHREGNTYSTAKRFTKAGNPNSSQQALVRNMFAQTSAGWSNLTEDRRKLWNSAAPDWVNTGIFGAKRQSGKNLFTGCNIALSLAGLPYIVEPMEKQMSATLGSTAFVHAGGILSLDIQFDSTSADNAVELCVSSQQSSGTSVNNKKVILANFLCDEDITANLTALYTSRFGAPVAGKKLFWEVKQVSQGGNVISITSGVITF